MAKVSSTARPAGGDGGGDGQNAPSASAPAGRVTRSTRSQSRDPVEQKSPRRTRGGKQQAGDGVGDVGGGRHEVGSGNGKLNSSQPQP